MNLKQTEYKNNFLLFLKTLQFATNLKMSMRCAKFGINCVDFFFVSAQMRTRVQCTHVHKRADASAHGGSRIECDREVKND